jgi:hypothetical protein
MSRPSLGDPDGEAVTSGLEQSAPLDFHRLGLGRVGCYEHLARPTIFEYQKFMATSISNIRKKRGRGRPKVGAVPVMVRLLPEQATSLDDWRKKQIDRPGRPEAIRRLIDRALAAAAPSAPAKAGSRRKAADLAGQAIDSLGDQTATVEERAHRKRRLIKGPREFRDVRGDQPKQKKLMGPRLAVHSQLDCGGSCSFRRFARSAASLR